MSFQDHIPVKVVHWAKPMLKVLAILLTFGFFGATLHHFFSSTQDIKHRPILFASVIWPGYEPLYMAGDLGFLPPRFKLIDFYYTSQVRRSFLNGSVDLIAVSLNSAIALTQHRDDLRIILALDISDGADKIISQPNIKSAKDLKGKRIGADPTALGDYFLSRFLSLSNLKLSDVELMPTPINEQLNTFRSGAIDAFVSYDPVAKKMTSLGGNTLFDSSDIYGEILDVVVTTKKFIEEHPADIRAFYKGWFNTLKYIKKNKQISSISLSKRMKINSKDAEQVYNDIDLLDLTKNLAIFSQGKGGLQSKAESLIRHLNANKTKKIKIDISSFISTSLIQNYATENDPSLILYTEAEK